MLILEIAAQGVKGVAPAGGRLALRPGYNVVSAEGPALKRLLEALLYPGPRDADAIPRSAPGPAGPGSAPVRAGLTLVGNDQVTYRLLRDFAAGCQLQRYDAAKRAFAPVSQDLAAIAAHLQGAAGVPARGRLAALLSLWAAELPSRAAPVGLAGAPALAPERRPASPEKLQRRIAELRGELERAKRAEKVQFKMDGLQSRLFKLEEALREGARIRDGLQGADSALAELGKVGEVATRLGDAEARLAAYAKAAGRRDDALARAGEERQAIDELERQGRMAPFWQAPAFLAWTGAGLALFVIGAVGAFLDTGLRYLALLDIPAFGAAALVVLRHIDTLEERSRVGRRRRVVEERERKAQEQFERDSGEVRKAIQELGLPGLPELREALAKHGDLGKARAEWQSRQEAWEAQPDTAQAREEKARIENEMREAEGLLSEEAGGYLREPRSIEAEISRLEQEAAAAVAPAEPAPAATPAAPAASVVEPLRGLLERAGAELSQSPAAVVRGLQAKASQLLTALSAQRLAGLSVDDRGNLQALLGGRPQPALGLPPADRDLCFLALRIALLEQALQGAKAVGLADEAFAGLPESARRLAGRMLKQAARPGQLIHATRDPILRESADHSA